MFAKKDILEKSRTVRISGKTYRKLKEQADVLSAKTGCPITVRNLIERNTEKS